MPQLLFSPTWSCSRHSCKSLTSRAPCAVAACSFVGLLRPLAWNSPSLLIPAHCEGSCDADTEFAWGLLYSCWCIWACECRCCLFPSNSSSVLQDRLRSGGLLCTHQAEKSTPSAVPRGDLLVTSLCKLYMWLTTLMRRSDNAPGGKLEPKNRWHLSCAHSQVI